MPTCMSTGTKIGASSAHFALAEPTKRFTNAVRKMMPTMVTPPGRLIPCSTAAPLTASSAPTFDAPKACTNSAQKNAITM